MKKLLLGLVMGALLVSPALADHVNEPTNPVVNFTLGVENYAENFPTDCQGSALTQKIRLEMVAEGTVAAWQAGNPSEHFAVGVTLETRTRHPKTGQFVWTKPPGGGHEYRWEHQNIPPHHASTRYNVGYATVDPGQPNGGTFLVLAPGYYRITAKLLAHESGAHFVRTCEFTIS